LQHGLLRPSFVPPAWQRELRELTRYRTSVIEERSRTINRLQKILEDTNLKLSAVASDLMGLSAREMLAALTFRRNQSDRVSRVGTWEDAGQTGFAGAGIARAL
jgi:transposase